MNDRSAFGFPARLYKRYHIDPAVYNLSITDCEPLVRPSSQPNFENRLNGDIFFITDKSLTLTQHVNADNGPPLVNIYVLGMQQYS